MKAVWIALWVGATLQQLYAAAPVRVSAAISLQAALEQAAALYKTKHPEAEIHFNFEGSAILTRQIVAGAPVDIFISADDQVSPQIEATKRNASKVTFTQNQLILIAPSSNTKLKGARDLVDAKIKKIATGERSAAIGRYTYSYLESAGLLVKLKAKMVHFDNVRAVFSMVAKGKVDAGFVYATDFKALNDGHKVRQVEAFSSDSHAPIIYPAFLLKNPKRVQKEASAFFDFLQSSDVRALLLGFGFRPGV